MRIEEFQWCPRCGAALDHKSARSAEPSINVPPEGASETVTCGACGTTFLSSDLAAVTAIPPALPKGTRNPLALVVVAVIAAAMLYFGVHMSRRSAGLTPRVTKSSPAPDFTLESMDGKSLRLSDLRGKAVLLNFWATWCVPCKIETPWLVELQNKYGPEGLQVIGVEMADDSKEDIAKFTKDMGVNYPVLIGKEAVGEAYGGVPGLPESFFIGRDGKIVDKIIGLEGKAEIEDSIRKALATEAADNEASGQTMRENGPAQK